MMWSTIASAFVPTIAAVLVAFFTRQTSIVGWTLVPARDAGVNPCRLGSWSDKMIVRDPDTLPPLAFDWCVGTELDRMHQLYKHMRRNKDPTSDFSAAVDYGCKVNAYLWHKDDKFTANLKIVARSQETMTCGENVHGVNVFSDRNRWVVISYYDLFGDPVEEKLTTARESCLAQFIVEHYVRPMDG
jgi:hypothetical protein